MSNTPGNTIKRHAMDASQWLGANRLLTSLADGQVPQGFPVFDAAQRPRWEDNAYVDRRALAEALGRVNKSFGNTLSNQTLEAIGGDGLFVIAGQQPMLAGGPMLCWYKLLHAVKLAEHLCEQWQMKVLPAFWLAGEDHDLDEVNVLHWAGKAIKGQFEDDNRLRPVGQISPSSVRESILALLGDSTEHADLRAALNRADWSSFTTLFASLVVRWLGAGRVVLIDPMRMRSLFAAPLSAIVRRMGGGLFDAFEQGRQLLDQQGYQSPLDNIGLFEIADGVRQAVELSERNAILGDQTMDYAGLAEAVMASPDRFSPGAALRPIVQDAALPTVCTLAGPTELQYLWQIDPLFEQLGIRRSAIWPRFSATLIEQADIKLAGRFGLTAESILNAPELLEAYDPSAFDVDDGDLCEIESSRNALIEQINRISDAGQDKLRDKAVGSIEHQVGKLVARLREQRLSQRGVGKSQLKSLVDRLAPGGKPQERILSMLELIGRHGPNVVERLLEAIDPLAIKHFVIELDRKGDAT